MAFTAYLSETQTALMERGGGGAKSPCSVIAFFVGEVFLAPQHCAFVDFAQEVQPHQTHIRQERAALLAELARAFRLGCDVYTLMACELNEWWFLAADVICRVVDASTAQRRWSALVEYMGVHARNPELVPSCLVETMAALGETTTVYAIDANAHEAPLVTLRDTRYGLSQALRAMDALAYERRQSLAAALTYHDHTICVVVRVDRVSIDDDSLVTLYDVVDSLDGMWRQTDSLSVFCEQMSQIVCTPHTFRASDAEALPRKRLAATNMPGMFYMTVFQINKHTT